MNYHLSIDIGASSGRHMLVYKDKDKLYMEEIYRFSNGMIEAGGSLCWDVDALFNEVLTGIKICKDIGKVPYSLSIDTWGVDYVLLDKDDTIVGKTYAYRDARTQGIDEYVHQFISEKELYSRTGIQKQLFNTIYQLVASKRKEPEILEKAEAFLMIPDYLNYRLTGIKTNEYTNATTTGLINCSTNNWDYELIEMLGLPNHLFQKLEQPMHLMGEFSRKIQGAAGYNCKVIACASHDTGSAVIAAPLANEASLYLSSGTWSLLGVENKEPITNEKSREANFTNEGGYNNTYRHLKNIMGLWMIQCAYHELDEKYSYSELSDMAEKEVIETIVDCNDERFFAPESMINEIRKYALETNQTVPETAGEIAAVVYNSLAESYKKAIAEIESITGRNYNTIHIIGGGANADYLNRITARVTGCTVYSGPIEATAIGNAVCQMIASGEFENLNEARECIKQSFDLKEYGGMK